MHFHYLFTILNLNTFQKIYKIDINFNDFMVLKIPILVISPYVIINKIKSNFHLIW